MTTENNSAEALPSKTIMLRHYGQRSFSELNSCSSQVMYATSVSQEDAVQKLCQLRDEQDMLEGDVSPAVQLDEDNSIVHAAMKIKGDLKLIQKKNLQSEDITLQSAANFVPDSLYALLKCVLADENDLNDHRPHPDEEIHRDILSIGQDIAYQASRRRLTPPTHIGIAMSVHQATRSKSVVQLLHAAGHCVSYDHLQRIDTTMAKEQVTRYEENNVLVPPNISPGSLYSLPLTTLISWRKQWTERTLSMQLRWWLFSMVHHMKQPLLHQRLDEFSKHFQRSSTRSSQQR